MGRREHREHLFYERRDVLQFSGDVLPLRNCTGCGGNCNSRESLSHIKHGPTNSRFKKLFVIMLMKIKLMKRVLSRIDHLKFREDSKRAPSYLRVGVDGKMTKHIMYNTHI
jgi:hypothetical protein